MMEYKSDKCKRCIFQSHGACYAKSTEEALRKQAIKVLSLNERSYQRHDNYCPLYINHRSIERALDASQRLAVDARTHGDQRLAENCIERFQLCRRLLPHADIALIDREISSLYPLCSIPE